MMFTSKCALKRRLVLIDIENIVGGAVTLAQQVFDARNALTQLVNLDDSSDHVVVACGRESAEITGFAWTGARRFLFRPGIDGADLELHDVLETENVAERFDEVVLASGDGIFTEVVASLGSRGVPVTIASRTSALSTRLMLAATNTLELDYKSENLLEAA